MRSIALFALMASLPSAMWLLSALPAATAQSPTPQNYHCYNQVRAALVEEVVGTILSLMYRMLLAGLPMQRRRPILQH